MVRTATTSRSAISRWVKPTALRCGPDRAICRCVRRDPGVPTLVPVTGSGESPTADPRGGHQASGERRRLAIAYDHTSSSPMAVAAMLSDVCDITWVVDMDDPSLGSMGRLLSRLGAVVDTGHRRLEAVVDELAERHVDGVIAFTDSQVLQAAVLAHGLELVHNPAPVLERFLDKYAQRAAMADAGLAVPPFRLVPAKADARVAKELADELRFPMVLKPLRGDSSRDVIAIATPEELADALETGFVAGQRPALVLEEYIPDRSATAHLGLGGYVSVETVVVEGVPVPMAVTGKFPLVEPFREAGNFMPHPLDSDEVASVLDLANRAALALEVATGALHIEVKLTDCGPRLIEVNGRIGGGAIDALFTKRFGRSLTEIAARVAMGEHLELTPETPTTWSGPFTYEFFAQPPTSATRFAGVDGTADIVGTAGADAVALNRSPGDELDWRAGSQGYVLQVGGVAPDLSALAAVPEEVLSVAGIRYEYA